MNSRSSAIKTLADKLYRHSPAVLQSAMISAYGVAWHRRRFGGDYLKHVRAIQERERWPRSQWDEYCDDRLRRLIRLAYGEVPFYRERFREAGVDPDRFAGREDLHQVPLLDKRTVRTESENMVTTSARRRRLYTYQTSGTTGTPQKIRYDADTAHQISAFMEARVRAWAGVNWRDSRSMIGGRVIVPQRNSGPPYWRHNLRERQLYLSAFHIAPNTVEDYVGALNRHRPVFMTGFSASHFFLARLIEAAGLTVHSPRAVILSSETLTATMRETIARVFRAPVFDGYSGAEACCLASECPAGKMHVSPDLGIIEILDPQGEPVESGKTGEVVATGLLNFCQPFIRYRTGDLAIMSDEQCSCGRSMPLISSIEGRVEDLVFARDGREIVRFDKIYYDLPGVVEGQVIQEGLEHIMLRLVIDGTLGSDAERLLRERVRELLGAVEVRVEYVDHIERSARGKFQAVISRVSREEAEAAAMSASERD